ncbi:hypothetical protein PINS_up014757 [Pythium insidiosum]|nr:hypothetical protein PINS_up014757 [Pythium insidiosum]
MMSPSVAVHMRIIDAGRCEDHASLLSMLQDPEVHVQINALEAALASFRLSVELSTWMHALRDVAAAVVHRHDVDAVALLCMTPLARHVMPRCLSGVVLPTMLQAAASIDALELIDAMLSSDLVTRAMVSSVVTVAIAERRVPLLQLLFAHGYDVPHTLRCSLPNDVNVVSLLMDNVLDVNARGANGTMLLRLLSTDGSDRSMAAALRVLLTRGADPNVYAREMKSALCYAVMSGDIESIETLLAFHADIDYEQYGWTPLALACDRLSVETVRCLLDHGADVNVTLHDQSSALHHACARPYTSDAQREAQRAVISALLATETISLRRVRDVLATAAERHDVAEACAVLRAWSDAHEEHQHIQNTT